MLFDKVRQETGGQEEVRTLVVTHGGWIREMIIIFDEKLGCQFPEHLGRSVQQVSASYRYVQRLALPMQVLVRRGLTLVSYRISSIEWLAEGDCLVTNATCNKLLLPWTP